MTRGESEGRERRGTVGTGAGDGRAARTRAGHHAVLVLVIEIRRVGLCEKSWDVGGGGESWGFWHVVMPKSPHGPKTKQRFALSARHNIPFPHRSIPPPSQHSPITAFPHHNIYTLPAASLPIHSLPSTMSAPRIPQTPVKPGAASEDLPVPVTPEHRSTLITVSHLGIRPQASP